MTRLAKYSGLAVLALIALGLVIWYLATHPAPVSPSDTATTTAIVNDQAAYIKEDAEYYAIDVAYPQNISFPLASRSDAGREADRIVEDWVEANVTDFKAFAAENMAAIEEFAARGEEIPASFMGMYLSVTYEKKEGPRTLTYLFNSASFTGGAHGIEVPVTFTFNKATGEFVELGSLFAPGSGYTERLSQIARAELPGIIGEYANTDFILSGTTPEPANFKVFYFEGSRIVFLFPPYQVGPYVLGTVTLPIELSRLSDILREDFKQ